jgi:NADH:ubiquinone oxidoreductase subunit F (NADH-binding)
MTATLDRPASAMSGVATWTIGAPRLLAGLDHLAVLDHPTHLAVHGTMPDADLDRLLAQLDASGLAGRGGAGFPLATKLRALANGASTACRIVVNGTESEPASFKDRILLNRSPHLVLDGALAVAAAVGAHTTTVAVHDEQTAAAVRTAIAERPDRPRVTVHIVRGTFVAGEARALVRALDGGPAIPPGRRNHPTDAGVLLSNVETFAQVAILLRLGWRRFADTGTRAEPGTTLLTIGGAVGRPGVVEVPLGTPLGIVLSAAQARPAQAVVIGGYHGGWHLPLPNIELSRAGLASAGGTLGAGVVLVVDTDTCALGELERATGWLAAQSAKQCGPCHFGLPALAHDVEALRRGAPRAPEIALRHTRAVLGRGACAHPDGTARFVTSAIHLLHDEVQWHAGRGSCGRPVLGRLPVPTSTGSPA